MSNPPMVNWKGIVRAGVLTGLAATMGLTGLRTRVNETPLDSDLFSNDYQHVVVMAHQDDELGYAGLFQKQGPSTKYIWVTNGDGLAKKQNRDPKEYAAERAKETEKAMLSLGIKKSQLKHLGYSEVELYNLFSQVKLGGREREEALGKLEQVADHVYQEIKKSNPDVIWTLAYQGGHIEHDLTHLLSAYARNKLEAEQKKDVKLMAFPEYQFTSVPPFFVPFRFKPWVERDVHSLTLNDQELESKMSLIDSYPTQAKMFGQFKKAINFVGKLNPLRGGQRFDYQGLAKKEVFEKVPSNFNYSKSPNRKGWENYMFYKDSWKHVTRPIAEHLVPFGNVGPTIAAK